VEAHPFLKCGTWVRVKSGPLAGIEGIFVRKKNITRLVLSVEILGTAAAIEVQAFQVEEVNAPRLRDSSAARDWTQGCEPKRELQARMS
jgi:hypothetical protein